MASANQLSVQQLLDLEVKPGLDKIDTLERFGKNIAQQRARTSKLVNSWKHDGASVAGYGAARSGPTLISQIGLTGAMDFNVDDHPQKVKKYTSGDGIKILPSAELYKRMPAYTVILAWVHSAKIIETNKEYLEKRAHFVILCPKTRVVGKEDNVSI